MYKILMLMKRSRILSCMLLVREKNEGIKFCDLKSDFVSFSTVVSQVEVKMVM